MVFSSLSFAVFFTVVCILMALTNTKAVKALAKGRLRRLRHMILLLASYFFYGYWNWKFCFLMLGLTAVSYLCARGCGGKRRGLCIKLGVIVPISYSEFSNTIISLWIPSAPCSEFSGSAR